MRKKKSKRKTTKRRIIRNIKAKSKKESESLLSTPIEDILSINPFNTFLGSIFSSYEPKQWTQLISKMKAYYKRILIDKGGKLYLPKGTKLYHGSLEYPFSPGSIKGNKERLTFFGLDIDISIWYILELIEHEKFKKNNNFNRFGFLYMFVLNKDLEVTKILEEITNNPKEDRKCKQHKSVCLHPQVAFRGDVYNAPSIYKLCSEITLFYHIYSNDLDLQKIYIIDPLLLEFNKTDPTYKPRSAVLKRYKPDMIGEDIDLFKETIDAETYKKYYLSFLNK